MGKLAKLPNRSQQNIVSNHSGHPVEKLKQERRESRRIIERVPPKKRSLEKVSPKKIRDAIRYSLQCISRELRCLLQDRVRVPQKGFS